MLPLRIHVVAFDVPFPPNYGGAIDVFWRLAALRKVGVEVQLHSFVYGHRPPAEALLRVCESVHYYPRKLPRQSLSLGLPYIVYSRRDDRLLRRLAADDAPILFEGLHTCFYLDHPALAHKPKYVRMHNVEWEYYQRLAEREPDLARRLYYKAESGRLLRFEDRLRHAQRILAISPRDAHYFAQHFPAVSYLPAFHPHERFSNLPGRGSYYLYHGKLSVSENHEAALYLVEEVFSTLDIPLIVAGAEPRPELITALNAHAHISLRHNPHELEMRDLMQQAHGHVLPTFQPTGIKLKLLNALYAGRHVIANGPMVADTGLERLCLLANTPEDMRRVARHLFEVPFTDEEQRRRAEVMGDVFSPLKNAQELADLIRTGM